MIILLFKSYNPLQQAFEGLNAQPLTPYTFPVLKIFKSIKKILPVRSQVLVGTGEGLFRSTIVVKKFIAEKIALGFTGTSELIFIGVFKSV